jgi:acyl-coenzyme A thioesterase PaaI-like protein
MTGEAEWPSSWGFGLPPLAQATAFAEAVRDLTETVLALDEPSPVLDDLITRIRSAGQALRGQARVTARPRVGTHAGSAEFRPYLDHGLRIGAYNPVFPEYTMTVLEETRAGGTVRFPVPYEGPPGCVHGGFLAVFFDAVISHHGSETGTAGKTRNLELRYRRPTPLGETLTFEIRRTAEGRDIVSDASLFHGPRLTCAAWSRNVATRRDQLPAVGARMARPKRGI